MILLNEMPERVNELLYEVHTGIAMEVEQLAASVQPGKRLLFVGSGIGGFARLAACCFECSELHMVDKEVAPNDFEPVCPEFFYELDVLTEEFVEQLRGKVDIVLCFMVTHELEDPVLGLTNILKVLPNAPGCFAWFLDLTAFRWKVCKSEPVESIPEEYRDHVIADLQNVERLGLDDQDHVYSLYEAAVQTAGHTKWGKGILGDPLVACDIYEVTVGNFE